MAPDDGVCQLSGHDQRVFTYVLTLNDSSEQGSRCMASVVVMHCPATPLAYVFSKAEFLFCFLYDDLQLFTVFSDAVHLGAVYVISPLLHSSLHMEKIEILSINHASVVRFGQCPKKSLFCSRGFLQNY